MKTGKNRNKNPTPENSIYNAPKHKLGCFVEKENPISSIFQTVLFYKGLFAANLVIFHLQFT